jgi:hypothetical protein
MVKAAETASAGFVFDGAPMLARLWKIHWTSRPLAEVATSRKHRPRAASCGCEVRWRYRDFILHLACFAIAEDPEWKGSP